MPNTDLVTEAFLLLRNAFFDNFDNPKPFPHGSLISQAGKRELSKLGECPKQPLSFRNGSTTSPYW